MITPKYYLSDAYNLVENRFVSYDFLALVFVGQRYGMSNAIAIANDLTL